LPLYAVFFAFRKRAAYNTFCMNGENSMVSFFTKTAFTKTAGTLALITLLSVPTLAQMPEPQGNPLRPSATQRQILPDPNAAKPTAPTVAKPIAPSVAPSVTTPTAPTAPIVETTEKAPKKPMSEGQKAARERQKACAAEWKAEKAAGKVAEGTKWPQYYSACNKRLKQKV
jgi:type IV secretory pathway VirB10-like protein